MKIKHSILLLQSEAGMTQAQIAQRLGCGQSNISALLNHKRRIFRPSNKMVDGLRRLLSEYGLTEPTEDEVSNI